MTLTSPTQRQQEKAPGAEARVKGDRFYSFTFITTRTQIKVRRCKLRQEGTESLPGGGVQANRPYRGWAESVGDGGAGGLGGDTVAKGCWWEEIKSLGKEALNQRELISLAQREDRRQGRTVAADR